MIHFAPFGAMQAVCGKLLGKKGVLLFTANEELVDCPKCRKNLGLDRK